MLQLAWAPRIITDVPRLARGHKEAMTPILLEDHLEQAALQ